MPSAPRTAAFLGPVFIALVSVMAISVPVLGHGRTPAGVGDASRVTGGTAGHLDARADGVLRRVVWDQVRGGGDGIHLRSSRLDGTDVRTVYDSPVGFTLNPTLDGRGRRVAFGTCCRDSFPQLIVAPVRGGKFVEPLARHRDLTAVGGIGWSPDGSRLAFEAYRGTGEDRFKGIWTIRPSGRDLNLVLRLPSVDDHGQPVVNDALGWTRAGILYSDGNDLRSARNGRSRLILRNVDSVRISGNHRRVVVVRNLNSRRPPSVWLARTNGTVLRRVLVHRPFKLGVPSFNHVIPNYDASQMLSRRSVVDPSTRRSREDVVRWHTAQGPSQATIIPIADGSYVSTWN